VKNPAIKKTKIQETKELLSPKADVLNQTRLRPPYFQ